MTTQQQGPFGARVFLMGGETIRVYQTRKRGTAQNARYVVHPWPQQGRFVDHDDDEGIADAIREALNGKMP